MAGQHRRSYRNSEEMEKSAQGISAAVVPVCYRAVSYIGKQGVFICRSSPALGMADCMVDAGDCYDVGAVFQGSFVHNNRLPDRKGGKGEKHSGVRGQRKT